ncbi:MAG TPA: diacylglycerol kinase family protein [Cyclobacteriaceae bacterium]|nr:diacylglycerol kinase family protein [Cyclobacteriaceae bacterium]
MKKFSLRDRIKSFKYAGEGIGYLFRTQHNMWIHAGAAFGAIALGYAFEITTTEWCLVIFAIGFVFSAEVFNTAIEVLTDLVSPGYNDKAKAAKDLAAAGVLFAAGTALLVALIVFGERIFNIVFSLS